MSTPFMDRLARLAVEHGINLPAKTFPAVGRKVYDRRGPDKANTCTDAELLETLRTVAQTDPKLFAPDATPGTKRQSPAASGYEKICAVNEQAAARERSAAPSNVRQHMEQWARNNESKLDKMSVNMRLDLYETEREAFLRGERTK